MTRRAALPLAALVLVVAVTAAWWALALWPTGPDAPAWIERTRAVCFGAVDGGLPDTAGWVVMVSEPLGMLAFLVLVWRDDLREAFATLRRTGRGRVALGTATVVLLGGIGAATARVAAATEAVQPFDRLAGAGADPTRLDRPAPALSLVDQHGDAVGLEQFHGRPVVVAFAYAHCETVCPLIVHDAAAAVERTKARDAALLVVTLDPWRDTPARLATIAEAWHLARGDRVLGGTVDAVEQTLDAWQVARARDASTGQIAHPTSVYLIDRRGRLAFIAGGDAPRLAALLDRL